MSANAAGCGAIGLWALLAVLDRAAPGVPPLELVALSFAVSGVLGLGALACLRRLPEIRQPPFVWLHGVAGLFLYHAFYFAALTRAPTAAVNLINYLWPLLIVVLAGPLLGLRLTRLQALGAAVAVLGCGALLGQDAAFPPGAMLGYALAGAGAMTWALYSLLARRLAAVPLGAMAGFCAGTAVLAMVMHALTEQWVTPSGRDAVIILLLGLGPVGIAFVLWDRGMKRGDPRLLGTLAFATPVLSTVLLGLFGYVPIGAVTLVAAALVAAGGLIAAI